MAKKASIGRRRKIGARRRKPTIGKKPLGTTVKAFGKTWTKKSCHTTKASANKSAAVSRRAGKAAMVKKNPTGGSCVFVRGKKKSA
jgi:hypothetical protein